MFRLRAKVVIFFTHTMGIGRGADSRPSVSLRRGGESPPFDTDMRSEGGGCNGLETSEKKLRRSREKVAKHYAYSFIYVRGLKDYVQR